MAASILACAAPNEHDAETQFVLCIQCCNRILYNRYVDPDSPGIVPLKLYLLKQLILK